MLLERFVRRITQIPGARSLWRRYPAGPLDVRVRFGIFSRPHYAYGVYTAASLAERLHLPAISVMEFGVAGGRGLLALEGIADEVGRALGIKIAVYGFDSGKGMPPPADYRDLPHVWEQGFYEMDQSALRASLKRADLIVGDVASTVPAFLQTGDFAPIGFIAFDLDYYSSTKAALELFGGEHGTRLPRVFCYFDDIMWPEYACHNEYMGELCAIREFNAEHEYMKMTPIHMFSHTRSHPAPWNDQIYVMHDYQHPLYRINLTPKDTLHTQHRL